MSANTFSIESNSKTTEDVGKLNTTLFMNRVGKLNTTLSMNRVGNSAQRFL